jgi:hypothetical protein
MPGLPAARMALPGRRRYNGIMLRTGLHRRLIALVAAYGVALQALLAGAVAFAPSAVAASVICAGERPGGPQRELPATPHHGIDCAFCTLTCAGGVALPASLPSIAPIAGTGTALRQPHVASPIARSVVRAGLARGPPA